MIARIVGFSTNNPLVVGFLALLLGVAGVASALTLPIDAVPDITNVQVQVLTPAPAFGPLEVEQLITVPVETVMGGLPHLTEVRSLSKLGISAVTLVFDEGTDIYFARQQVAERLAEAREAIPAGYGSPTMGPISTGLGEVVQFEVRGEPRCKPGEPDTDACFTTMELRSILDQRIAPQLRSVKGVVEVNSFGGEVKTYQVEIDPRKLVAHSLSLSRVFAALDENNANAGGASIERAGEQILVRGEALITSIDDIKETVVDVRDGTPVKIADLGNVIIAPLVREGVCTRDGDGEVVLGIAIMLLGENSRVVSEAVKDRLVAIEPILPKGVSAVPYYDRTELIDRTIHTVEKNLLEGGILVIIVLLLLLGNLRGGLLVASAIPLSMLAAFIGMKAFHVSGNLMSLGAIDFGLIVDGSVVIVEAIVRRLGAPRTQAEAPRVTIEAAATEVARPVAFAVAIIIIVYVPVLSLEGIEGKMFKPMALAVVFALVASLLVSLTWMPAVSTILFRAGVTEKHTWLIERARRVYGSILPKAMSRPKRTVLVAVAVLAVAAAIAPFLGAEFIPTLDEHAIALEANRIPSTGLDSAVSASTSIERVIKAHFPDEVAHVVNKIGRPEIATDPMGFEQSDVYVMLTPTEQWKRAASTEELSEKIHDALDNAVPGASYSISQPIELRMNELISGSRADVSIGIYGDDLDELQKIGQRIGAIVGRVPGAADVKVEQVSGVPVLRIKLDRARAARWGVAAKDVLDVVASIGGKTVGEVNEGQWRVPLQVRLAPTTRNDVDAIKRVAVSAPDGTLVPLGQLADLSLEDGPAQISRDRIQRRLSVDVNVRDRDIAGFVSEARATLDAAHLLPAGYSLEWGGQFKNLTEATNRLAVAVPFALLLIFVLLVMAYGAMRPALLIFLNVPFAATGGVFALALRGMPFSISAGVGFIALFGVAVLNGVVLVSEIRSRVTAGSEPHVAVVDGSLSRLRPVLMTALVASLGFVPMAFSTSAGAEVQRPLATVVIGGLLTSTLLTLIVLPVLYARVTGNARRGAA